MANSKNNATAKNTKPKKTGRKNKEHHQPSHAVLSKLLISGETNNSDWEHPYQEPILAWRYVPDLLLYSINAFYWWARENQQNTVLRKLLLPEEKHWRTHKYVKTKKHFLKKQDVLLYPLIIQEPDTIIEKYTEILGSGKNVWSGKNLGNADEPEKLKEIGDPRNTEEPVNSGENTPNNNQKNVETNYAENSRTIISLRKKEFLVNKDQHMTSKNTIWGKTSNLTPVCEENNKERNPFLCPERNTVNTVNTINALNTFTRNKELAEKGIIPSELVRKKDFAKYGLRPTTITDETCNELLYDGKTKKTKQCIVQETVKHITNSAQNNHYYLEDKDVLKWVLHRADNTTKPITDPVTTIVTLQSIQRIKNIETISKTLLTAQKQIEEIHEAITDNKDTPSIKHYAKNTGKNNPRQQTRREVFNYLLLADPLNIDALTKPFSNHKEPAILKNVLGTPSMPEIKTINDDQQDNTITKYVDALQLVQSCTDIEILRKHANTITQTSKNKEANKNTMPEEKNTNKKNSTVGDGTIVVLQEHGLSQTSMTKGLVGRKKIDVNNISSEGEKKNEITSRVVLAIGTEKHHYETNGEKIVEKTSRKTAKTIANLVKLETLSMLLEEKIARAEAHTKQKKDEKEKEKEKKKLGKKKNLGKKTSKHTAKNNNDASDKQPIPKELWRTLTDIYDVSTEIMNTIGEVSVGIREAVQKAETDPVQNYKDPHGFSQYAGTLVLKLRTDKLPEIRATSIKKYLEELRHKHQALVKQRTTSEALKILGFYKKDFYPYVKKTIKDLVTIVSKAIDTNTKLFLATRGIGVREIYGWNEDNHTIINKELTSLLQTMRHRQKTLQREKQNAHKHHENNNNTTNPENNNDITTNLDTVITPRDFLTHKYPDEYTVKTAHLAMTSPAITTQFLLIDTSRKILRTAEKILTRKKREKQLLEKYLEVFGGEKRKKRDEKNDYEKTASKERQEHIGTLKYIDKIVKQYVGSSKNTGKTSMLTKKKRKKNTSKTVKDATTTAMVKDYFLNIPVNQYSSTPKTYTVLKTIHSLHKHCVPPPAKQEPLTNNDQQDGRRKTVIPDLKKDFWGDWENRLKKKEEKARQNVNNLIGVWECTEYPELSPLTRYIAEETRSRLKQETEQIGKEMLILEELKRKTDQPLADDEWVAIGEKTALSLSKTKNKIGETSINIRRKTIEPIIEYFQKQSREQLLTENNHQKDEKTPTPTTRIKNSTRRGETTHTDTTPSNEREIRKIINKINQETDKLSQEITRKYLEIWEETREVEELVVQTYDHQLPVIIEKTRPYEEFCQTMLSASVNYYKERLMDWLEPVKYRVIKQQGRQENNNKNNEKEEKRNKEAKKNKQRKKTTDTQNKEHPQQTQPQTRVPKNSGKQPREHLLTENSPTTVIDKEVLEVLEKIYLQKKIADKNNKIVVYANGENTFMKIPAQTIEKYREGKGTPVKDLKDAYKKYVLNASARLSHSIQTQETTNTPTKTKSKPASEEKNNNQDQNGKTSNEAIEIPSEALNIENVFKTINYFAPSITNELMELHKALYVSSETTIYYQETDNNKKEIQYCLGHVLSMEGNKQAHNNLLVSLENKDEQKENKQNIDEYMENTKRAVLNACTEASFPLIATLIPEQIHIVPTVLNDPESPRKENHYHQAITLMTIVMNMKDNYENAISSLKTNNKNNKNKHSQTYKNITHEKHTTKIGTNKEKKRLPLNVSLSHPDGTENTAEENILLLLKAFIDVWDKNEGLILLENIETPYPYPYPYPVTLERNHEKNNKDEKVKVVGKALTNRLVTKTITERPEMLGKIVKTNNKY